MSYYKLQNFKIFPMTFGGSVQIEQKLPPVMKERKK